MPTHEPRCSLHMSSVMSDIERSIVFEHRITGGPSSCDAGEARCLRISPIWLKSSRFSCRSSNTDSTTSCDFSSASGSECASVIRPISSSTSGFSR